MRVVILKIKCESPSEYKKKHFLAKLLLSIGFIGLICSYGMEIYEKIVIDQIR